MRDVPNFLEREEVDLVPPKRLEKDKTAGEEEDEGNKNALSQAQSRGQGDTEEGLISSHERAPTRSPSPDPPAVEDTIVEAALVHWRSQGQPSTEAHHIWRLYDSLTHHLSFTLCEQLRLILEPTKATRLQGDFRTGKRLNMKKIIPYIASDYTKDKIWLRRTRPSQREYQVLIALDDSRSMAESHAVHLALETLALVSKALNRLEVGDVAVAKFGAAAEIVHDFAAGPFSDAAGANVVSAFKFDQAATDVLGLLEASVRMLGEAREKRGGGSAAELWQLMIIISDGVCQEHEKVRAMVRRAAEQKVVVVFVVIDAKARAVPAVKSDAPGESKGKKFENSILDMQQASYKTVNGRMELHMQRYLDTFPFEFYAILKSVETLPEVLADTLKQFFERVVGDTRFN
jgi:midasin